MGRVLKRESAKRDLIERWVWFAENGSIEVADRFLDATDDTLQMLSRHPQAGHAIPSTRLDLHGLRRFPIGGGFEMTLVFYFPLEAGIDVIRVLHGSRDLETLFS